MWKKCCLWGLLLGGFFSLLWAQSELGKREFIYVPQKDWKIVLELESKGVQISYREYENLLQRQPRLVEKPLQSIVVQDVVYRGEIHEQTLSFWMEMNLVCLSEGLTPFEFDFGKMGISEATLNDKQNDKGNDKPVALFSRDIDSSRSRYKIFLPGAGSYTFRMLCHQKMESKRDEQFAKLELGNFPEQIFRLSSESRYVYSTRPQHGLSEDKDFLEIFLGSRKELSLSVRPKEKEDEKKAIELLQIDTSHLVKEDSVFSRFRINLEVHHRPLRTFQFVLPAKMDLLSISESRWDVEEKEGERLLTIQLERELLGQHQISISGETRLLEDCGFSLPKLEGKGEHLLRQTGQIYVEKTSDIKVQLEEFSLARQVNLQKITPSSRFSKGSFVLQEKVHSFGQTPFLALEYWEPKYEVWLHKSRIKMALESSLVSAISIYPDGFEMATDVTFDLTEGEVKELSLRLPVGWTLTSVKTLIAQNEKAVFQNAPLPSYYIENEILYLPLEQKLVKKQRYKVFLELKHIPDGWQTNWSKRKLSLPTVIPLNCRYLPSFTGIIADSDYQIKTSLLRKIDSVDLKIIRSLQISSENLALGLKLFSHQAQGTLEITRKTPRVSLVAAHYIRVGAEEMRYATTLAYSIKNASVNRFRFRMDGSFTPLVHVQDEHGLIKEKKEIRENGQRIWEIELQKKVMGAYSLYLSSEVPLVGKESFYTYPKIEFEDLDNLKGFIGVESSSQSEILIESGKLDSITTDDVPIFAHPNFTPQRDFSYSLKYTQANYQMNLRIGVRDPLEVSEAVLQSVNIATIYPGSEMERVECVYRLSHLGLQFFHLQLPLGADFWSAVVDGKGEKPLVGENSIAIPVKRRNDGQPNEIKIVYQRRTKSLSSGGKLQLERPQWKKEIPARTLSWQVYLPQEYRLAKTFSSTQDYPWYTHALRWISSSRFLSSPDAPNLGVASPETTVESYSKTLNGLDHAKNKREDYEQLASKTIESRKSGLVGEKASKKKSPLPPKVVLKNFEKEIKEIKEEEELKRSLETRNVLGQEKKQEAQREAERLYSEKADTPSNQDIQYPDRDIRDEVFEGGKNGRLGESNSKRNNFGDFDFDGKLGGEGSSTEWEPKKEEKRAGYLLSDLELRKSLEKISEAGIEATKAKGLRSMDISLNTQVSFQGSKTTSPSIVNLSVSYSHINTQRSLHFFFVMVSVLAGVFLLTHFHQNRFAVFMIALLLVTFLPAFLGVWFIPHSNALVLGLFLSVLLNLVSWFLGVMARPLGLRV